MSSERVRVYGGGEPTISIDELMDGSANIKTVRDGQTIQSVIEAITDASESNSYEVMVPPGFYEISETILINKGHISLVCPIPFGARIKIADGANCKGIYVHHDTVQVENVMVSGFSIDGNKNGQTSGSCQHGITVGNAKNVRICNNFVTKNYPYHEHNSGGSGITVYPDAEHVWVTDNIVDDAGDRSIQVAGNHVYVARNQCINGYDRGISWDTCYEATGAGTLYIGTNIIIENNYVTNMSDGSGIKGNGCLHEWLAAGQKIDGLIVRNNDVSDIAGSSTIGIWHLGPDDGPFIFSGNKLTDDLNTLKIELDGSYTGNAKIERNHFLNTRLPEIFSADANIRQANIQIINNTHTSSATGSFHLKNVRGVIVKDNQIDYTYSWIKLENAHLCTFQNNIIHDGTVLLDSSGTSNTGNRIIGNYAKTGTGGFSGSSPLTDSIIKDNFMGDSVIAADSEELTGTLTMNPSRTAYINSSGGAVTATLADGTYMGQRKTIVMTDATASSTVSATHHVTSDPEIATFDDVDETWILEWTGTEWITIYATCTFV